MAEHIAQRLPTPMFLPAVGQGALGWKRGATTRPTRDIVEPLDDAASHAAVLAERAMLAALRGGCLAPIAAWARLENGRLTLVGRVLSPDGAEASIHSRAEAGGRRAARPPGRRRVARRRRREVDRAFAASIDRDGWHWLCQCLPKGATGRASATQLRQA